MPATAVLVAALIGWLLGGKHASTSAPAKTPSLGRSTVFWFPFIAALRRATAAESIGMGIGHLGDQAGMQQLFDALRSIKKDDAKAAVEACNAANSVVAAQGAFALVADQDDGFNAGGVGWFCCLQRICQRSLLSKAG